MAGLLLSLTYCRPTDEAYLKSISEWHRLRIDSLKGKTGFLNLAGLYWLDTGSNSFGSDSVNHLVFPAKAKPNMGTFILKDSLVYLVPRARIKVHGKILTDTTLVYGVGEAKNMEWGSLHWFIIKRGQTLGVRLRDFEHPLLNYFDTIDYYPTNPEYKVNAQWEAYPTLKTITFANVLGMQIPYPVYGAFHFTLQGQPFALEPLGKPEADGYFVMFYDKTSGNTTYGSGRYLYVNPPDSTGATSIDFNKAFNPPCAFTQFATCLFPHKANRLPIFVEAGEKFAGH